MKIALTSTVLAAAAAVVLGTAGAAQADDQSYLDYLFAHGFTYHPGAYAAPLTIELGHQTCDKIHETGNPRAGLMPLANWALTDVMIEGAQHELCPDTLEPAPAPVGEPS